MLSLDALRINPSSFEEKASAFISDQTASSGLNGAVVAVSGGIDSAVTLALSVRGLGKERVRAITMPERDITAKEDIDDVMRLTRELDVTCDLVDITSSIEKVSSIIPNYDPRDRIPSGNIRPRLRMTIVYHYANISNSLVIGSSNKTEWLMGYFTKHGDGASDIMPLADLYKTQVRQLAVHLGIPKRIVEKAPSARLWQGQTTEGELGMKFERLDRILYGMELGLSCERISRELGIELSAVERVSERVRKNEHKRHPPLILRLS